MTDQQQTIDVLEIVPGTCFFEDMLWVLVISTVRMQSGPKNSAQRADPEKNCSFFRSLDVSVTGQREQLEWEEWYLVDTEDREDTDRRQTVEALVWKPGL